MATLVSETPQPPVSDVAPLLTVIPVLAYERLTLARVPLPLRVDGLAASTATREAVPRLLSAVVKTTPPFNRMVPANVLLPVRASVTAGLANDVLAVNQYAATMYAATANGMAPARRFATPQIVANNPNEATNSLRNCAAPARM